MNTLIIVGATAVTGVMLALAPNQSAAIQTADPEPVSITLPVINEPKKMPRSKPQPPCSEPLAVTLWETGFRGQHLAMAWAIVMRESNGQNIIPGDPRFNGEDYGIFQLNKPTWGDEPWWDDEQIVTVEGNARIAYQLIQERGFTAWGLNSDGSFNFSSYGGWSDWQRENWIVRPYLKYLNQYWETCYPLAGEES